AFVVEMPDVPGRQPPVLAQDARRLLLIAPIAVHDELAADHDLAVVGDADLSVLDRRADGIEADARARPVTGEHRPRLGLSIALKEGNPERFEEQSDFGIERRAAGHPRLLPAADFRPDLLAQRQ